MKIIHGIIRRFFEDEEITYTREPGGAYRFGADMGSECRIRSCSVLLMVEDKRLLVNVELPFRVKRAESRPIAEMITRINGELEEYECFELDLLDGLIRFRLAAETPTNTSYSGQDEMNERLRSLITFCLDTIEDFSDPIVSAMFSPREERAPRPRKEPAKKPDIEDILDEFDDFDELDDIDDVIEPKRPAKKQSGFKKLLEMIGIIDE